MTVQRQPEHFIKGIQFLRESEAQGYQQLSLTGDIYLILCLLHEFIDSFIEKA